MKRLTGKRRWNREGVSELIGTILILALTVLLFSSIIAFVGRMPAPVRNTQVTFVGRVQASGVPAWSNGAEIFVTHNGGKSLLAPNAKVILTVNGSATAYAVADGGSVTFIDNGNDDSWDPQDVWKVHRMDVNRWSIMDVAVIDQEHNTFLWSTKLQGANQTYAPIVMEAWADADLTTARHEAIQNSLPFTFYAKLSDPNGDLDVTTPTVDMSRLGLGANIPLVEGAGGVFSTTQTMGTAVTSNGYYPVTVRATDLAGHVATRVVLVVLGQEIGAVPNIAIDILNVTVDPTEPTNGDTVHIRVKVSNFGLGNATVRVEVRDGAGGTQIDYSLFNIGASPDETTERFTWHDAGPGGNHELYISAVVTSPIPDADTGNNFINYSLTIMPTILLVDDDNHDGGELDSTRYMREALDSGGFDYDLYTVPGGSGPSYQGSAIELVAYDVVIWNCGYESTSTLTADDRLNLNRYLSNTSGRPDTGSLWLIGQHVLDDPVVRDWAGSDATFGFASLGTSADLSSQLVGNPAHPVASNWSVPASYINTTERIADSISYILSPSVGSVSMFNRSLGNSDAISRDIDSQNSRRVIFGWDFGRIDDISVQTDVAYAVVLWLGNLAERDVIDFAVTGQYIVPETVFYREPVSITAFIRNNGDTNRTVSADLLLDSVPLADSYRPALLVPGGGGKISQTWTWNATLTGLHSLIVRVDPDGAWTETNEDNNQAGGLVTTTTISVMFRVLVVDDDGSANNGGTLRNESAYVTGAIDAFGGLYNKTTIYGSNSFPVNDNMNNYSAIIWVCGDEAEALTANDTVRLQEYLSVWSGEVWLQGKNASRQMDTAFLRDYFGVTVNASDAPLPDYFTGKTGDILGHGIYYAAGAGTCDVLDADGVNATGYLWYDQADGTYVGVRSLRYPTVVNSFSLADLADGGWEMPDAGEARSELAFITLDWLGRPDARSELKIACVDVGIEDLHPQIGNSYVLRATVHNLAGYAEASALVRFMDENTTIGSDSVSVMPNQNTTAEVIWRPLATGSRTLRVIIDPLNETGEAFEWFNNNATHDTYVYFFYDDMESGTDKWTHEATLLNINSEGPLNFLPASYTNVKTDVIKDWDYGAGMTNGVDNVTRYYHSFNESYFMEEPTGYFGEADVLVSFAIDTSKSMSQRMSTAGTWLDSAKNAAKSLLDGLSDDSVCVSIWHFGGNNEERWSGPNELVGGGRLQTDTANKLNPLYQRAPVRLGDTYVSAINGSLIDGRQKIRDEINLMDNPSGTTILWDAAGEAYLDTEWFIDDYPDLIPAVIVLSDGADSQASDQSSIAANRIEGGSDHWCPWDGMGNGTKYYDDHKGKYTFDWTTPGTTTQWLRSMQLGSMQHTRLGLLHPVSEIMMFTVGLGLEHHAMPPIPAETRTVWPGEVMDNTYALCTDTVVNPACKESGTLEYNLWRIANTSGAEYFYAPDAEDLEDIFDEIARILSTGFNQTRSSEAVAPNEGTDNFDKQAVSPAVDLSGYQTAKLSFWHKYNLLPGGNGGVLGVEVWDTATSSWKFLYIIPSGVYTGGLYYKETEYDDFGNRIQWCFNGVSSGGTFGWDHVEIDILPYIPTQYRSNVRVAFHYMQFGGGTGAGWYLDDVQLRAGRGDVAVGAAHKDVWALTDADAHDGNYSWWNGIAGTGLKSGIDNVLTTIPIDLTSAVQATLNAYLKFNINTAEGIPPDCVRVEVTSDGGATWNAVNLGVRAVWGVSGTGADADDGKLDGKTYTGLDPDGDGWVAANTLSRLNVDLSAWRGHQIQVRFRVVANNDPGYLHYATNAAPWGVYIDDVTITGLTKYS